MQIDAIRFIGARHGMIHRTAQENGMTRMIHGDVRLPPGQRFELKPGDFHIMLMGVTSALLPGCRYPFQILWGNGDVTDHEFITGTIGQMMMPESTDVTGDSCP